MSRTSRNYADWVDWVEGFEDKLKRGQVDIPKPKYMPGSSNNMLSSECWHPKAKKWRKKAISKARRRREKEEYDGIA